MSSNGLELEGELSLAEVSPALLAAYRFQHNPWRPVLKWSAILVVLSFVVNPRHPAVNLAIVVAYAIVSRATIGLRLPGVVKGTAARQVFLFEPFTIRIDDEGVDRRTSRDHHRRAWADFSAWFELEDQIVLLDRGTGVWPIPKGILAAKAEPFREILRKRIGPPGKKRP